MTNTIDIQKLQHCEGKLANILIDLNRAIMQNMFGPVVQVKLAELFKATPDREAFVALFKTLGRLRWPANYGQSPWDDLYDLMSSVILGHAPSLRTRAVGRKVFFAMLNQVGLPTAKRRLHLDSEGRQKHYHHLLKAMIEHGGLTYGKADKVLRILLNTPPWQRSNTVQDAKNAQEAGRHLRILRQAYTARAKTKNGCDECVA